jgi:D-alanyl-D-alanine carboxypeptidase/D-alanyl-D-alanine-endopeptidase (penicillin-binding protein 4)
MRRLVYSCVSLVFFLTGISAQTVQEKIQKSVQQLLNDPQMRYATLGFSVVNSETGAIVYEYNGNTGLAPASCQKTVTSATAFELLGKDYTFTTKIGHDGTIAGGKLNGNLHITGAGDPTLGSWRYSNTSDTMILRQWKEIIHKAGIKTITGNIIMHGDLWESSSVPGGWPWDDMGNYYGAGAYGINWRENQYDLVLKSGPNTGDPVLISKTIPKLHNLLFTNELKAGKKGSGDNAYIFSAPYNERVYVRGTIPPAQKSFTISGSMTNPQQQLAYSLAAHLAAGGKQPGVREKTAEGKITTLHTQVSPMLDSINYWFMKKSINLYGESLVKAMAFQQNGFGATEDGLEVMKNFWKEKGIDPAALRMIDGSGLSPQNRVTTHALIKVLQYARTRSWYSYYLAAFPEYNKMKLKSGTIGGSKGFVGYHTSKDGTAYTIAMLVNNYDGSASEIVKKMFLVLDELK